MYFYFIFKEQLLIKQRELQGIEAEIHKMSDDQDKFNSVKQKLELARHELNLIRQRLKQTTHHRQQEEINQLKTEIGK